MARETAKDPENIDTTIDAIRAQRNLNAATSSGQAVDAIFRDGLSIVVGGVTGLAVAPPLIAATGPGVGATLAFGVGEIAEDAYADLYDLVVNNALPRIIDWIVVRDVLTPEFRKLSESGASIRPHENPIVIGGTTGEKHPVERPVELPAFNPQPRVSTWMKNAAVRVTLDDNTGIRKEEYLAARDGHGPGDNVWEIPQADGGKRRYALSIDGTWRVETRDAAGRVPAGTTDDALTLAAASGETATDAAPEAALPAASTDPFSLEPQASADRAPASWNDLPPEATAFHAGWALYQSIRGGDALALPRTARRKPRAAMCSSGARPTAAPMAPRARSAM